MSKFARNAATRPATSPVATMPFEVPTYEGGRGVARDPRSELFLLAVTNMVREHTFYESARDRDARFLTLVEHVTRTDPEWVQHFIPWLRTTANMRTASLVAAAHYVNAKGPFGRSVVGSALHRADEPAEILAYWRATFGRKLPCSLQRGVADAVTRLYTSRAALRYDGTGSDWRMADVIEIVHPKPRAEWQAQLFAYLLDKRHGRRPVDPEAITNLGPIQADIALRAVPEPDRRRVLRGEGDVHLLESAGWSWERLSGWLPGGMDAEAWTAAIPRMGYMALLRNLRNFDEAGVDDETARRVMLKLTDPSEVAASRLFPYRFYQAWREVASLRWAYALEVALDLSLARIPRLAGRTLVLVDCSGSMDSPVSGRSKLHRNEAAALFGAALAKRCDDATLVRYGSAWQDWTAALAHPLLKAIGEIGRTDMGGTYTFSALQAAYTTLGPFDRVVIFTDEQAHDDARHVWPTLARHTKVYTFNVAGYAPAHAESGRDGWHTFGGLTDAAFQVIPLLERAVDVDWPTLLQGSDVAVPAG